MQARARLLGDDLLGPLNLGVTVKDRVALLWGPVPSHGLKLRAELVLRTMIELNDVRNGLFVDAEQPGAQFDPMVHPAMPSYLPPSVPAWPPVPMQPRRRLPELFPDVIPPEGLTAQARSLETWQTAQIEQAPKACRTEKGE